MDEELVRSKLSGKRMGLLCMQHELKPIYFLKTVIKIIVYSLLDMLYTIR